MHYLKYATILLNSPQSRLISVKTLFACILLLCIQNVFAAGPYTYSADGSEVTDAGTGLVWYRCSVGQTWSGTTCTGTPSTFDHRLAMSHASSQTGWRMPNVKELASIVSINHLYPSIDTTVFPNTVSGTYWSATPFGSDVSYAWYVSFSLGLVNNTSRIPFYYVRLVR